MLMTRGELEARIKVALGGTVAEEIMLAEISTGATSDLNTANRLATQMVREYGMSRLGRIYLSASSSAFSPLLNRQFSRSTTLPGSILTPSVQFEINSTGKPNNSLNRFAIGLSE